MEQDVEKKFQKARGIDWRIVPVSVTRHDRAFERQSLFPLPDSASRRDSKSGTSLVRSPALKMGRRSGIPKERKRDESPVVRDATLSAMNNCGGKGTPKS